MGDTLLRAGLRLSCRNRGLSARTEARRSARLGALPRRPRADARGARAVRDSLLVDVQLRLLAVCPGGRHLDARLVHGADGRLDLALDAHDRHHPIESDAVPADLRSAAASDASVNPEVRRANLEFLLSVRSTGLGEHQYSLRARAVDRRDGRGLRVRRDRDPAARGAPPALPAHRLVGNGALRARYCGVDVFGPWGRGRGARRVSGARLPPVPRVPAPFSAEL